jgi:hypothetical protein
LAAIEETKNRFRTFQSSWLHDMNSYGKKCKFMNKKES